MTPSEHAGPYGTRQPFTFLVQGCPCTLREGMAEFAAAQPGLLRPSDPELARFIAAHDACHVLFGLTTVVEDEAIADLWTLFGSDMPVRRYAGYLRHPELASLFVEVGAWQITKVMLRGLPRIVRTIVRVRRMRVRWAFWGYADHLDTPVADLRQRFGVQLM